MANRKIAKIMQEESAELFGEKNKWSLDDCETAIDMLASAIIKSITVNREKVLINGFGTFEPKIVKAHGGINFQTNEHVIVPEKFAVKFKPGKIFKEAIKAVNNQ